MSGHKDETGIDRIWIDVALDADTLAWDKEDGLLPVVVQDADTRRVLMVGYVNREALQVTLDSGNVTFFSRSKQRLWTKGESSGNVLEMVAIEADCDRDTLLVQVRPRGPTCHCGVCSSIAPRFATQIRAGSASITRRSTTVPSSSAPGLAASSWCRTQPGVPDGTFFSKNRGASTPSG